ncbi:MAG: alpha/beta fold hydrolase, partial [Deltaproteobacteria bacterium]|nr:alpha/beta fold hydrolase [Deltaproteobacteria bacterium]
MTTHAMTNEFQRGTESLPFAALRTVAEVGAETGFFLSPTGPLRFFLRGKPDAPPLLILHGMGDTGPGWGPVIPRLARHFRVHALDLPGHGLSVAPGDWRFDTMLSAVRAYAQSLEKPVLVGHSLGGWLGARLALEGAVPLRALVLVNPAGAALSREAWEEFRTRVDAQDVRAARLYLKLAFHVPPPLLWLFPKEVLKVMQAP